MSAISTRFFYDGYKLIQELSAVDGAVQKEFVWDPTEQVATRPLFMQQRNLGSDPSNYFFTHDGNKNVSDVVSYQRARGVVAHCDYAPFGAVTSATGSLSTINPFRFSSEYHDDTLGLVYYNYRHYNPQDGRWIARDIDEYLGLQLYAFCFNASVFNIDRLGLKSNPGNRVFRPPYTPPRKPDTGILPSGPSDPTVEWLLVQYDARTRDTLSNVIFKGLKTCENISPMQQSEPYDDELSFRCAKKCKCCVILYKETILLEEQLYSLVSASVEDKPCSDSMQTMRLLPQSSLFTRYYNQFYEWR